MLVIPGFVLLHGKEPGLVHTSPSILATSWGTEVEGVLIASQALLVVCMGEAVPSLMDTSLIVTAAE